MAPRHFPPDLVFGLSASDDSPLYSSDSCYSPISEAAHSQVHPQSYLPRYDKALASTTAYPIDYHSQMATPIPMLPSYGPWTGLEGNSRSGTGLGLAYEEPYPTSVGISQSASITHEHPVDSLVEPTTPKALAFVERSRGDSLRARPTFATGLVASKHNLVNLDDETMSHYLACYWEHFHPQFPIVHKPSPPLTETRSVLNTILLAIGAQFSTRPHAKLHSTSWFSFAARSCAILDTVAITSRSPISNLQAIVLLEILSLYRSRSSGVYKSVQFEALYSKLSNDSEQSEANITAYVQKIPKNANVAFLRTANRHWADLEARRRILLAAFVIDTQRTIFFQQPPCQTSIMPDRNLPVPCSEEAFECADVSSWFTLLFQPRSSSLSTFQQSILQSCQIHTHSASIFTGSPPSNLSLHALSMATRAPIPSLLTVAAESWLFSRKVETPAEWANAKIQLRNWVHGDEASKAVWHAGHVLRAYFARQKDEPISGLHELWSLYLAAMVCWAYGFSVLPHLQQANQSAEGYLASLDLPSWKDVESVRGAGGTQNVLASVRARLKGKGNGALITEGERVLERLIEGRGRLCWF
ncbi:hypothetical protein MMC13_003752 [Lambiella insularis]|nr:hypothetical protein [Lambiella insularis]